MAVARLKIQNRVRSKSFVPGTRAEKVLAGRMSGLLLLALSLFVNARVTAADPVRPPIDPARLAAAGIRQLDGKFLTLYTDLAGDPEVDALPRWFDQAVPQWCAYFGVDPARLAHWRLTGCVMKAPAAFQALGLLAQEVPNFEHGYSLDDRFWLNEQPTPYARRHLLLHEGTHAFMNMVLGGCGPRWYMEAVAELLATHRIADDRLQLNSFPRQRGEVPMWGRIKLVQDNLAEGRSFAVADLIELVPGADRTSDGYGWVWALAAFLDGHPRYQARFRQLPALVLDDDFNARFLKLYADDWRDLELEWRTFANELDFGDDLARGAIEFTPAPSETREGVTTLRIAADRGWQNSGVVIEPNTTYRVLARGQYEVAQEPEPWICEPGGVSIEYYRGRPLGQLLAAVRPADASAADAKSFLQPIPVGLGTRIRSSKRGTLYLRINESPAKLADNRGELQVAVERE